jgi:hypothetical protein
MFFKVVFYLLKLRMYEISGLSSPLGGEDQGEELKVITPY